MIQRIQSIYLALTAICGIILFLVPVFQLVPDITAVDTASYQMSLLSVNSIVNDVSSFQMRFYPLIILNLLAVITSLTTVFLFKKRKLQIKLCGFSTLVQVLLIVLLAYDTEQLRVTIGPAHLLHFNVGAILLILPIIFLRLAGSSIKKDDDLVRSADRLR